MVKKILVVEDEGITSLELKTKLQSWGYSVVGTATSAEEALEMTRKLQPDLITMDVFIRGDEDGIQAAENIQKEMEIPLIYLTAYSSDLIMERAHKTSPYAYIIKPFEDNELKFAIELALKKHNLKKELKEVQERYNLISENSGDVIWILDINSQKFVYVSRSVETLRGYSPEEVLEQSMEEVMTPESYKRISNNMPSYIKAILSGDESLKITAREVDQIHKNGSIVPTEVVVTFLTNEEGKIDRVLGVTRNLSKFRN